MALSQAFNGPEDCWHPGSFKSGAQNLNKHFGDYKEPLKKLGYNTQNRSEYTKEALKFLAENLGLPWRQTTVGKEIGKTINGEKIRQFPGWKTVKDNVFLIVNETKDKIVNFGTEGK